MGMLPGPDRRTRSIPRSYRELFFYYDEREHIGQKVVRYTVFTENEILLA